MPNSYTKNKELIVSHLNFARSQSLTRDWLQARGLMAWNNRNLDQMMGHLISEIDETEAEAEKRGSSLYSPKAEHTELTDVFFLNITVAQAVLGIQTEFEMQDIRPLVNGQGRKSSIFDDMRQKAGNLENSTLKEDLQRIIADVISLGISQPVPYDHQASLELVIDKNQRNYPVNIFDARDHVTGKVLDPEERQPAFDHRRTSINFVRRSLKKLPEYKDREYGLHLEDYERYLDLIQDFRNSGPAFIALARQFSADYNLPLPPHLLK